jgi:tetratricopeptide (TPR) repeat protein
MPPKAVKRRPLSHRQRRDLDIQIEFLEGVLRRDPRFTEALQLLGDTYSERGRHADTLKVDRRLIRREPRSPNAYYNLACSQALNGRADRAATALEKAIALGYRDFKWLARDPDLSSLRQHPHYRRIQEKIRGLTIRIS